MSSKNNFNQMNNNIFLFAFVLVFSIAKSQVGVNTPNPQGVFNIDGSQDTSTSRLKILRMLEKLGLKKAELANKLKKEKQMGKQVELNIQVKKINDEITHLKANL